MSAKEAASADDEVRFVRRHSGIRGARIMDDACSLRSVCENCERPRVCFLSDTALRIRLRAQSLVCECQ
jgi:hypothetical protein